MNVECGMRDGIFEVKPSRPKALRRIATGLWPSFPSDLVSLVTVLATQAEGRTLDSRDLRSGMSLIAAGLAADGQTQVTQLETVERGYGQLVERLKLLGAQVQKVE
jgi:UDP-N-acetylglucosamine 1-carboxyvinyltransferase